MLDFYKTLIKHPKEVGSAIPSSPFLAKAIARAVPDLNGDLVVELGPGTGVITKALLKHGVQAPKLIAIEKSPLLAKNLKQKVPTITVIEGNATELSKILKPFHQHVGAVISSLPLRSIEPEIVNCILRELDTVLPSGTLLIQYTYSLSENHELIPSTSFTKIHEEKVWLNIPPAKVQVFKKI